MIRTHVKYLRTCIIHKWYVLREAVKLGIYWRGLLHDFSKLSLREWLPRVNTLVKLKKTKRYDIFAQLDDALAMSWLYHYHANPHHWQWWVTQLDNGEVKVLAMTDEYRREMLADWRAVSQRPDRQDVVSWYLQNRGHIMLHPETRRWIEKQLCVLET